MVAVVGSSNVDLVLEVEHFTVVGETQRASSFDRFPGGKGANQAVASRRLGTETLFLSCIGNDENGQFIERILYQEKLSDFLIKKHSANGFAFIEVCLSTAENRIMIYPGANSLLTVEEVEERITKLLFADILVLQNEIPLETTVFCARKFHEAGKFVILDPAPAEGITKDIAGYVDLIMPNESEAKFLCGYSESAEILSKAIIEMGFSSVLLKMGEKGSYYNAHDGSSFFCPAFAVDAVDTTAAGDVFVGAFAAALDRRMRLRNSTRFASAAAAISVTRKGAQTSIPVLDEVKGFLKARDHGEEARHN
ncbi:MAG TPA: ribokinase [Kosmotogaceae bacterium]|nr:MAG: Ribokinase [Thermotogales bacterium 46_20]HAA85001.1 ribokinase [Kosmotogaceae bacterium]